MVRPLRSFQLAAESHDSGALGLAVAREPAPPSVRRGPMSARLPAQLDDFAFADTINVRGVGDDGAAPPSRPIFVNDDDCGTATQCVTPLAYPVCRPPEEPARSERWATARGPQARPAWRRADLARAAMMGAAVLATAVALLAATSERGNGNGAGSSEVRSRRTLQQHTPAKILLRKKR